MKKRNSIVIIGVFLLSIISTCDGASTIVRKQARNYIEHIIDTLLAPNLQAGHHAQELEEWSEGTIEQLLNDKQLYIYDKAQGRLYNTNMLYKEIVEKIVSFIKHKSLAYAQKDLKHFFIPQTINKDDLAHSVAQKIHHRVLELINSSTTLESGALMNFVGGPLKSKVHALIKERLKYVKTEETTSKNTSKKTYATAECPICYEDFGSQVHQLFLQCGHNLCADCVREIPKQENNTFKCPLCRAEVVVDSAQKIKNKKRYYHSSESRVYEMPPYTYVPHIHAVPAVRVVRPVCAPVIAYRPAFPSFGFGFRINL